MALDTIAEIEISYNPEIRPSDRIQIKGSDKVADVLIQDWENLELYETFKIMLLNRANRVLGVSTHSKGGIAGTVIDVRLILATALKAGACQIIIAHNHPSGNLNPSEVDMTITNKIKAGCKAVDITLLDHIILTSESFFSFSDEGLI